VRNPPSRRTRLEFKTLRSASAELARAALDLILPARCPNCSATLDGGAAGAGASLCERCTRELPRIFDASCSNCDEPLIHLPDDRPEPRCEACANRASPLTRCRAGLWFEADTARWIHAFKYPPAGLLNLDASARSVIRSFARLAASRYRGEPPLVVPIPLHPRRLRERGFNPAATIAREVARELRAPLAARGLERIRDTPSQTGLGRRDRRRNVAHAFRCRLSQPIDAIVLLVDDVVTTGSTLEEAARTLLRAGAFSVGAMCAARTRASNVRSGENRSDEDPA
jgi:ComF family protein